MLSRQTFGFSKVSEYVQLYFLMCKTVTVLALRSLDYPFNLSCQISVASLTVLKMGKDVSPPWLPRDSMANAAMSASGWNH